MISNVSLVGRVGQTPELRYTASKLAVLKLSVATWKNKKVGEQWEQVTSWHKVSLFGKQAESAASKVTKGAMVYVSGELEQREYVNKDNLKVRDWDILAGTLRVLDSTRDQSESATTARPAPYGRVDSPQFNPTPTPFTEDDIPF